MSSDGQFELEEKLDILSLHPTSSSGHGVSDIDDYKTVNNDERVCQASGPVGSNGSARIDAESCCGS